MGTDSDISRHYTRGDLLERLHAALLGDGIDPDHPTIEALAPFDQFHGRGLEATEELVALHHPFDDREQKETHHHVARYGKQQHNTEVCVIPMAPMVVNALKEWKLACPKGDLNLVFPNGRGNVESHSNIFRRGFAPLQIKCGITKWSGKNDKNGDPIMKPKYSLHALRHAAASLFIEQDWTPKRVQTVMGHASIAMTYDLYGKLFKDPEDDKRSMELLQARLLG